MSYIAELKGRLNALRSAADRAKNHVSLIENLVKKYDRIDYRHLSEKDKKHLRLLDISNVKSLYRQTIDDLFEAMSKINVSELELEKITALCEEERSHCI